MQDFPALILGLGLIASASTALADNTGGQDENSGIDKAVSELNATAVQETLQWLKDHASDPASMSQDALNRAALQQLLASGKTGATLLPAPVSAPAPAIANANAALPGPGSRTLWGPVAGSAIYVRKGTADPDGVLQSVRSYLTEAPTETKVLILDLRAPGNTEKLAGAAGWAGLFLPAGTPLFQLRSSPAAAPVAVVSVGEPVWKKRVWLLLDEDSGPLPEVLAHCLVKYKIADLTFGAPTPGTMLEYKNQPLGAAWILRLPDLGVHWPDGARLTGTSLIPSIPIKTSPASKSSLMSLTDPAQLAAFLTEKEPARPSEAALLAGTPAELLATDLTATPGTQPTAAARPDPVLQQARDLVLTAEFLNLDAPVEIKRAEPGK